MPGSTWMTSALVLVTLARGGQLMANPADHPWSQQSTYVSNSLISSKFWAQDFVPDGNLQKAVWRGAAWKGFDRSAFSATAFPQSATEVASRWTRDYVYFAFRCKYSTLNLFEGKDPNTDFWTLWDRDVVEIFLNPQPEHMRHYYEFEVAPNNLWIDLEINFGEKISADPKWNSGFQHATRVEETQHLWTCELRIPLAALIGTKPLETNTEWRINFFRCDGPGDDTQRRFLSWSPVHNDTNSFHAPWSFGVIRFVE